MMLRKEQFEQFESEEMVKGGNHALEKSLEDGRDGRVVVDVEESIVMNDEGLEDTGDGRVVVDVEESIVMNDEGLDRRW